MSSFDDKPAAGASYATGTAGESLSSSDSTPNLELTGKENARSQLREGDAASGHLHGVYAGALLSTIASTARSARTQKDWAESALRAYTNAISLDPSLAEAFVGRAKVYRFLERYAEAKADLQHAEQLGIGDATHAVDTIERGRRLRWLVVAGVSGAVAAICVLWIMRATRPVPPPTPTAEAVATPAPARIETRPTPEPPAATPPQTAAPTLPPGDVAPPTFAPAPLTPLPLPQQDAETPPAASAQPAPPSTASTSPKAPTKSLLAPAQPAAPPELAAAPPAPTPAQPHACSMCDSVVAGLPAASALSKEDLAMTRLACRSSESGGADAYSACVSAQIARLEQSIPMPDLSALPEIDRRLLERACTGTASDGPAAYRRCVSSQLISLAGAPDLPDLSTLPAERRRAIELACRDSAGAAAYHTCMERRAKEARRAPARAPG